MKMFGSLAAAAVATMIASGAQAKEAKPAAKKAAGEKWTCMNTCKGQLACKTEEAKNGTNSCGGKGPQKGGENAKTAAECKNAGGDWKKA